MKKQYIIAFKTDDIKQFNENHGLCVAFEIPNSFDVKTTPNIMKKMFADLIEKLCE